MMLVLIWAHPRGSRERKRLRGVLFELSHSRRSAGVLPGMRGKPETRTRPISPSPCARRSSSG